MQENTVLTGMSAEFNFSSQFVDILGSKMHYVEQGSGDPILFLHGMPTSCYLWRNIIPFLAPLGRCIAPDLIGMGKSGKPDIAYTLADHIHYLEEFIKAKQLRNITLIMHGWGSLIGLGYAMRHPENCKGLVFYESFLRPLQGDDLSLTYQEYLSELQQQAKRNDSKALAAHFVDKLLPQTMLHHLTPAEKKHYREPIAQEDASKVFGKVLHQYALELPPGDGKSPVDHIIAENAKKLMQSSMPKLLLYSVPGFITTIATVMWAKENLPNLEVGDLGEELHYAQEATPQLMGELISAWLQAVEQGQG